MGAAVVEHPRVATMLDDDRVAAGDALVFDANVRPDPAADVGDVGFQRHEPFLLALLESEVVTPRGQLGRDRTTPSAMIEQRQRVGDRLAVRRDERGGVLFARRGEGVPLGGLEWCLGGHERQSITAVREERQARVRGD